MDLLHLSQQASYSTLVRDYEGDMLVDLEGEMQSALSVHLEASWPTWARWPGGKIKSARWWMPAGPAGNPSTWHFLVWGPPGTARSWL